MHFNWKLNFLKSQVTAQTATEVGDPKDAICEAVEKFKVSMLVLGSHGRGAIKRSVWPPFIHI